jgi:hypothetical protein
MSGRSLISTPTPSGLYVASGLDNAGTSVDPWNYVLKNFTTLDNAISGASILNYGAVADELSVSDGAITSGSYTLTSASGLFTAASVGKSIIVNNAGASFTINGQTMYDNLSTTIAAYTNSTTVVLAASAAHTVSGAAVSWGTDNTAAINAALAAIHASGGGICYCPAGYYLVMGQIIIPNYNDQAGKKHSSVQAPIKIMGDGDYYYGDAPAGTYYPYPAGGTVFDMRYVGKGYAPSVNSSADGTISASSTALTSATAGFRGFSGDTSGGNDAGQPILVWGAGSSGGDLLTTIATVNSATSVTLANSAVTSVSAAYLWWGTILAKIQTLGMGKLEIERISFINRQFDRWQTPFILSTCTNVNIHDVNFFGSQQGQTVTIPNPFYPARSGSIANVPNINQDGIWFGGADPGNWGSGGDGTYTNDNTGTTSNFIGLPYGSKVHNCHYQYVRRGVWLRKWSNQVLVDGNTWNEGCYCNDDAGFVHIGGPDNGGDALYIENWVENNDFNVSFSSQAILLSYGALYNTIKDNAYENGDTTGINQGAIYVAFGASCNTILENEPTATCLVAGGSYTLRQRIISSTGVYFPIISNPSSPVPIFVGATTPLNLFGGPLLIQSPDPGTCPYVGGYLAFTADAANNYPMAGIKAIQGCTSPAGNSQWNTIGLGFYTQRRTDSGIYQNPAVLVSMIDADGNFEAIAPGVGIKIPDQTASGSGYTANTNCCMGQATLNGTTAVAIATTQVIDANTRIFLTVAPGTAPVGIPYVYSQTGGTGFSLKSTSGSDTAVKVNWLIVKPTPTAY